MEEIRQGQHKMNLDGRKICKMQGIKDVIAFDTRSVVLETTEGMLTIKGEELHVSRLSLERGEIDLDGKVDSFAYTEATSLAKKGEGMLARLFS